MTSRNLPVDGKRLWDDMMALAAITDPERPWTRRAFTPRFLEGRAWLERRMTEAGLVTRIDAGGNLIGRRAGSGAKKGTIVIGSHSDTVPDGGRFDGVAGVVAGLEVARALQDQAIILDHDLEVIDCLAEEVSLYGVSCIGSRAMAGELVEVLLERRTSEGETLSEGLHRMGGDRSRLGEARRHDIAAFLELHIEQGPVLEAEHKDIGIVTAISGITRFEIIVEGRADHAGTTPMNRRADALVAASKLVTAIHDAAARRAASADGHFAATVGEFRIEPNAANVVPSRATFLVDMRAEFQTDRDAFQIELDDMTRHTARAHGVEISTPCLVSDNRSTPASPMLMELLEAACEALGATHRRMASGAGHDMAWLARIAPAAMIFVPCRGGRSHTPDEWAEPEALTLGASVLFDAICRLGTAQSKTSQED